MRELIEEAIKEFVEKNKQVNMEALAAQKAIAEYIDMYIINNGFRDLDWWDSDSDS